MTSPPSLSKVLFINFQITIFKCLYVALGSTSCGERKLERWEIFWWLIGEKSNNMGVGKNGFEHNNFAIFELKLHWVPQNFLGGYTWECVLLHEEMKIIY